MRSFIFVTLLSCCLSACIEPYQPEVGKYDSSVVIDGAFTDGNEPSVVKLSRSFAFDEEEGPPIAGAELKIEDDLGQSTVLQETHPGVYQTDPSIYKGEIGRRYRLLVTIPGEEEFQSDWEELKAAPPVESIGYQFEERIPDDPQAQPILGMQLLLSTIDPEKNTRFYRWDFEETYEYGIRYPPAIRVEFGARPGRGQDEVFPIGPDEYEGFSCWKTEKSTRILISSTENKTEDIIQDFPIHYVDNSTSRLYRRYSILVKQYAISKGYHEYLSALSATNQTTGSLFDPIPNELFGNIKSSSGEDIPVIGYFSVAGVSSKRIFVSREETPLGIFFPSGPSCVLDTLPLNFRTLHDELELHKTELFDYLYAPFGIPIGFIVANPECAKCSTLEATNRKPDYW
ncbi:MAG: DUF4249 domain-containing protein [Saprospiraceae bacterium]|nr:DUF4249 domain-containing protein [Saprospiraceae bacterium]